MNNLHVLNRTTLAVVLLLSFPSTVLSALEKRERSVTSALTDSTLPEAFALWLESPVSAERTYGPIGDWDTSQITKLDSLFQNQATFDEDISKWDTSKVTSMQYTFAACATFNSPLNDWDVSRVTNMMGIFNGASSFNQDLHQWNTAKVTTMQSAFKGANKFNARLLGWDTRKVESMEMMFYGATFFEDVHNSLQNWDVSAVTSMKSMFTVATRFQGDLSLWDPRSVETFNGMFAYAASFDPISLNTWDVSSAKFMDHMFYRAVAFEAELCWETLAAGVSGVEMLCGSSGSFDPDCSNENEPSESEVCPEADMEMEEDYEVRESRQESQQTVAVEDEDPDTPARGGTGGIGAMNPGAAGDHPEITARLDNNNDAPTINTEPIQDRSEEQPPSSTYDFEVGPVEETGSSSSESVAAQQTADGSSARPRNGVSSFLLLAATTGSLINFLI